MDSFILIFKGLQDYGFHNHFALAVMIFFKLCIATASGSKGLQIYTRPAD